MDQQAQPERRRYPRFSCQGKAEIRTDSSEFLLWGTVTDVSASGCYIELVSPLPAGQALTLRLTIFDVSVAVSGKVAVVHPMFGMGVAFLACAPEESRKLEGLLSRLASEEREVASPADTAGAKTIPAPAASPAAMVNAEGAPPAFRISPQAACSILDQVIKHLSQKGVLTRADFLTILQAKRIQL